ncbi:MAG: LysM peptidoglycan-binding domain-containing protein [Chitinophagaceae bacterium]|nr:LysM peptidoglycan-binding domain-containing protein [Chitinophagaceae bacterium]
MMKRYFCLLFLFIAPSAFCQTAKYIVKSDTNNQLYLEHKVAPKETFFSVGRMYNLHPRQIAAFNHLDMNKGLQKDQVVRIPLLDTNFTQKAKTNIPIYYIVGENEGLLSVSKKNNNVLLSHLREWNNLSSDRLQKGAAIIIGYLISSAPANETVKNEPENTPVPTTEIKPAPQPKPETTEKKPEEKPMPVVVKESDNKKKNEEAPAVSANQPTGEGYFKAQYEQQIKMNPVSKNETVTSGIFKTLSGWDDGKYYMLMDQVNPGTIVKVINPANNKAIYAKVLGAMAGIRQNQGYNIRISNAAAAALNVEDTEKFIVKIIY